MSKKVTLKKADPQPQRQPAQKAVVAKVRRASLNDVDSVETLLAGSVRTDGPARRRRIAKGCGRKEEDVAALVERFNEFLYGPQDYAVIGNKPVGA